MDSGIRDGSLPCNTDLFVQILLKLFISILQNGLPTEKSYHSNKLTSWNEICHTKCCAIHKEGVTLLMVKSI